MMAADTEEPSLSGLRVIESPDYLTSKHVPPNIVQTTWPNPVGDIQGFHKIS